MVDADQDVADMVWHSDIACPQPRPQDTPLNKHEAYSLSDGICWRFIP